MTRREFSVAAAGFCTFINLYAPQAVLPTLADAFHASAARAGLTITATLVAVALVAPVVGGISDALGRRALILGASFALVIPTALAALAPTLDWLVLWRVAQGPPLPLLFLSTVSFFRDQI